ncbi:hypothetical protein CALVIDRAFT_528521 [Calocera viscosa TUFC12733]|uniref:Uncharacterized protein n=1 Tax=Calocera viscosa (strain TUFC12733) TaxID=1330018 RepID=A0A167KQB1_CALVF|nr:hypothetical protein CALVIDRAFT_528521 [Calocera viscosa TUFC12733]
MALFVQGHGLQIVCDRGTHTVVDPHSRLTRDLWGFPEALLAVDIASTLCPFPTQYEGVCALLSMSSTSTDTGHRHGHGILMPSSQGAWVPAILRMQGFLKQSRVGLYGDWDGDPKNCMSAMNRILLEPGSAAFASVWINTWKAIRDIRRWYGAMTHATCADRENRGDMDSIRCAKRVFSRRNINGSRPVDETPLRTAHHALDQAYQRVEHDWLRDDPPLLGVRRNDGQVSPAHSAMFQEGDFVDVAISFDVVHRTNGTFNVYLRLEHIIQLAVFDNLSAPSIIHLRGLQQPQESPAVQRPTMQFAEDENRDETVLY